MWLEDLGLIITSHVLEKEIEVCLFEAIVYDVMKSKLAEFRKWVMTEVCISNHLHTGARRGDLYGPRNDPQRETDPQIEPRNDPQVILELGLNRASTIDQK